MAIPATEQDENATLTKFRPLGVIMDITLGELNKMSITKLKSILKKLDKEPKNVQVLNTIEIIKNLIRDKKRKGLVLYDFEKVNGKVMKGKWKPVHLQ